MFLSSSPARRLLPCRVNWEGTRVKSQESLNLRLFGVPQLSLAGRPLGVSPKPLALLAHLALNPTGVSREGLAELLWAPGKLHNVRQALYSLRALPGSGAWLDSGDPVILHAESDVAAFERAVRAGCAAEALAAWDRSAHDRLLFQGVDLPDVPAFDDWLDEERRRLHELYLDALRARLSELHAAGDHAGAAQHAETLIRLDPLAEEGYQAAMRAELARGQRERAILLFERCRRVLRDELDAEPAPATLDLLRAVEGESATRGKRALLLSTPGDVPARPPVLYGREPDLAACCARLTEHPQLLVQGFGGMGKTALAATLAAEHVEAGGLALWLEVGDDGPEAVFDALAAPFDALQQVGRGEARARSAALREVLAGSGVGLLVLDDVWNAYSLSRVAEALPPGVQLLATSRQRYPELPRLELDRLSRADALALLRHHAPGLPAHDPRADAVCALLGDHPFALRLAGITLGTQGTDLAELLKRLQERPGELKQEGEGDLQALLELSLERLSDLEYEVFLGMGGLFAPSATPYLLEILLRRPRSDIATACAGLLSSGLIERASASGGAGLYQMHDIAWQHARSRSSIRPTSVMRSVVTLERSFADDVQILANELQNIVAAATAAESARIHDVFSEIMEAFIESEFMNV